MSRTPITGPSDLIQQNGALVTYKHDFMCHVTGTGFRHTASNIDISPPIPNFDGSDLNTLLTNMASFMINGSTFITIGDGVHSNGSFTVGVDGNNTIEACLHQAFILPKLSIGGTILIKAGTYNFTSTVSVPLGINIIGELNSTILNVAGDFPIFSVSEAPQFDFTNNGGLTYDGYFGNKFINLIFSDNILIPDNGATLLSNPFISLACGSSVEIDHCTVLGRLGTSSTNITYKFIGYAGVSQSNSILTISNSYISCIQKIGDFIGISTSTLTLKNNRVFCNGICNATTDDQKCALSFSGCNANLINNQFYFGVNITHTIQTAFVCISNPSVLSSLVIIGNIISTPYEIENNLISFSIAATGDNFRSVISNNTVGGTSDSNSWYIVVGDGIKTVGDINGPHGLQNAALYFKQQRASSIVGHMTIFVKPGTYTIDSSLLTQTYGDAFTFGIVGLAENGNLPVVNLNISNPATNEQPIYLGSNIKNILFNGNNGYYRIYLSNQKPDSTAIYRISADGCFFNNCGIKTELAYNTNLYINSCEFNNDVSLPNCSSTKAQTAILCGGGTTNLYVDNCAFNCYGTFIREIVNGTQDSVFNLNVQNCKLTSKGIGNSLIAGTERSLVSSVNISNAIFEKNIINIGGTDTFKVILLLSGIQTTDCNFIFDDNIVNGNGLSADLLTKAISLNNFINIEIDNNTFKNIGICSSIITNGLGFNCNIENNKFITGTTGYGLCYITNGITDAAGSINICKNYINATAMLNSAVYFGDPENYFNSPIYVHANKSFVNICDNKINGFKFRYVVNGQNSFESCIGVVGAYNSNIQNNTIQYSNFTSTIMQSAIYAGANSAYDQYCGDTTPYSTNISNNNIKLLASANYEDAIIVFDIKNVTIQGNTIGSNTGVTYGDTQITAISRNASDTPIGIIQNNILVEQNTIGNDILYFNGNFVSYATRLDVRNNKGQNAVADIPCYKFKQYGVNSEKYISGSTYVMRPWYNSVIMEGQAEPILTGSNSVNVNKNQMCINGRLINADPFIINRVLINWNSLPNGLYYTNAIGCQGITSGQDGFDNPKCTPWYNHQILIPIDIDDFIKLEKIEIPIYLNNASSNGISFSASASLIYGNSVDKLNSVEYITDPATNILWAYGSSIVGANSSTELVLTNDIVSSYGPLYINPFRKNIGVSQSTYIVLALDCNQTTPDSTIFFAIPYVRVSFKY